MTYPSVKDLINTRNALTAKDIDAIYGGGGGKLGRYLVGKGENVDFVGNWFDFMVPASAAMTAMYDAYWVTNAGTGATAFAGSATQVPGGTIDATTGTNGTPSNQDVNMYGPLLYAGDNNVLLIVRMKFDAITILQFEVGWIDTITTITTPVPAFPDLDTPTTATGLGDAAVLKMDTPQTLKTVALVCLGSGGLNAGSTAAMPTAFTPTAATYHEYRIGIVGNNVYASIDRQVIYTQSKTDGIEGGTTIRPWIYVNGTTGGTARIPTIDYIGVFSDR
jgi:hypothetical protein